MLHIVNNLNIIGKPIYQTCKYFFNPWGCRHKNELVSKGLEVLSKDQLYHVWKVTWFGYIKKR
jgi:hypothetical protein